MKSNKPILLILPFMLITLLISCNFSNTERKEEKRAVKLNYTDWTESVAITMLARAVLEEKMGYQVELKLTDIESAYNELSSGQADFFADAWLPHTHGSYFRKYDSTIDSIGIIFQNPKTGLVVPEYSIFQSIPDLKGTNIPIIGIDRGAGIMASARAAIINYGLSNQLLAYSDDQMTFQMVDSIRRRKEVVVTGWRPHWIFSRHEVRFLKDPDHIFPTGEHIYVIGNKAAIKKHPNATEFFRRMKLTEQQFNSLIDQVKMATDPLNGIHQWMEQNKFVINKWVQDLQPERLKVM